MKIGHIILTSQNGGAEKVFIDYIKILKKIGHQNFAIIKDDAPYQHYLDELNIEYIKIKNQFGYYDWFAITKIQDFINQHKLDAIIAHAGKSIILARKAINKNKKNSVFLVAVNHSNNIKRSLCADLILSVNREIFVKTIDAKRDIHNSLILYNGLDIEGYKPSFENYNFLEKKEINLGVIGRFHQKKGFDLAINAFKLIKNNSKLNIKLKIAGDGEESKNLKNLVQNLKLESDIEFLGWAKNTKDFFSQIDIFILPSRVETFGLVILEAMKYGKPIITTNCDGPREILRENTDALFVNLKSKTSVEQEIVNAILKIIQDKDLANNLVRNSYNRLETRFTQKILEENLAEIFKI